LLKIIFWLVIAPMIVVVTVFSVVNRHVMTVDLWPLDMTANVRIFVVVLGALVIGVLWGGLGIWITGANGRCRARAASRRADVVENQASQAKAKVSGLEDEIRAQHRADAVAVLPAPADSA